MLIVKLAAAMCGGGRKNTPCPYRETSRSVSGLKDLPDHRITGLSDWLHRRCCISSFFSFRTEVTYASWYASFSRSLRTAIAPEYVVETPGLIFFLGWTSLEYS